MLQKTKQERYYKFSKYLKLRFGQRVHKVSVDAGFSCPNRDGEISKTGCIYCDNLGFSFNSRVPSCPLQLQIEKGIDYGRKRFKAGKFIVYFQAYTNTYAKPDVLKEKYDIIKKFKDIVGIAIGTRPDCIDEEILALINSYTAEYEVWMEYGLQSIHPQTLEFINRGHTFEQFLEAIKATREKKDIKICVHIILGLPGETKQMVLETAKTLALLKVDGVKIHPLHIIKGTKLEEMFKQGLYKPLKFEEYLDLTIEFLEYLWPETVIQRITADCPREFLVEPLWMLEKNKVLEKIENTLGQRNTFQGKHYRNK
ncbi:TIGR01212 family radical SAM protein [bacterium]|nr:TIGR01212 family radical SAM protein [bacterium]